MTLFADIARLLSGPLLGWSVAFEVGLAIDALRWRWRGRA